MVVIVIVVVIMIVVVVVIVVMVMVANLNCQRRGGVAELTAMRPGKDHHRGALLHATDMDVIAMIDKLNDSLSRPRGGRNAEIVDAWIREIALAAVDRHNHSAQRNAATDVNIREAAIPMPLVHFSHGHSASPAVENDELADFTDCAVAMAVAVAESHSSKHERRQR
jgi:hypothetical protein